MSQLLKCKACGFIIKSDQLGDICPACGVDRNAFEAHEPNISEKRRTILNLHLHPILTHFSNGVITLIFLFTFGTILIPDFFRTAIRNTIFILSLLLPLFVISTFLAGVFDGKTRFKQITTPHLKKKIIFGSIFLAFSVCLALTCWVLGVQQDTLWIIFFLSLSSLLCAGFLGKIGGTLLCAKLPG